MKLVFKPDSLFLEDQRGETRSKENDQADVMFHKLVLKLFFFFCILRFDIRSKNYVNLNLFGGQQNKYKKEEQSEGNPYV